MTETCTLTYAGRELVFHIRRGTRDRATVAELEQGRFWKYCIFNQDDVWLDAGACIGTFCVAHSHLVRWIVSYEPEADNYAVLLRNLRQNRIANVSTFHAALVGNDDRRRSFWINPGRTKGAHSLLRWRVPSVETEAYCECIDAVMQAHRVNCVKLNVEGAEHELLLSGERWDNVDELMLVYHHCILGRGDLFKGDLGALREQFASVHLDGPHGPGEGWTVIVCRKEGRVGGDENTCHVPV